MITLHGAIENSPILLLHGLIGWHHNFFILVVAIIFSPTVNKNITLRICLSIKILLIPMLLESVQLIQ